MARKVMQFRYYAPGDNRNQPINMTKNRFVSGSAFEGYYPIKQLGIQTIPGVRFRINRSKINDFPITVGHSGIYELELDDKIDITNLAFEAASMNLISNNPNSYLIIDIVYEDGQEE